MLPDDGESSATKYGNRQHKYQHQNQHQKQQHHHRHHQQQQGHQHDNTVITATTTVTPNDGDDATGAIAFSKSSDSAADLDPNLVALSRQMSPSMCRRRILHRFEDLADQLVRKTHTQRAHKQNTNRRSKNTDLVFHTFSN